jgi:hypothetical protein
MSGIDIAIIAVTVALLILFFINRILIPWQANRTAQRILKNVGNHDPRTLENRKYGRVAGNAEYLTFLSDKGDCTKLHWDEVEEVHAYKKDLLTTDMICLAFKKTAAEEYIHVHEEMAGYHDLLGVLPRYLAGFNLEWFSSVAFPAFDTNHQIIWRKSPAVTRSNGLQ